MRIWQGSTTWGGKLCAETSTDGWAVSLYRELRPGVPWDRLPDKDSLVLGFHELLAILKAAADLDPELKLKETLKEWEVSSHADH